MKSLEKQSLEATIFQLKNEATELGKLLASLYAQRQEAEKQLERVKNEAIQVKENYAKELADIEVAKLGLNEKEQSLKAQLDNQQGNINTLFTHEQELSRSISKLQETIASLQTKRAGLEADVSQMRKELEHRDVFFSQVSELAKRTLSLQSDLITLQTHRDETQAEITRLKEQADKDLTDAKAETADLKNQSLEWIEKRNQAENDFVRFTSETKRAKDDLEIIVARIEEKWQQTFPELRFPL